MNQAFTPHSRILHANGACKQEDQVVEKNMEKFFLHSHKSTLSQTKFVYNKRCYYAGTCKDHFTSGSIPREQLHSKFVHIFLKKVFSVCWCCFNMFMTPTAEGTFFAASVII